MKKDRGEHKHGPSAQQDPRQHMGPGPSPMGADHLQRLGSALGLNPEQQAKVRPIFEKVGPRMKAIQAEAEAKTREVLKDAHAALEPLLNDDQKKKLRELHAHMEASHAAHQQQSGQSHAEPHREAGKPGEHMRSGLDLNPDQQAKMKAAMESSRAKMKAIAEDSKLSPQDKEAKMRELHESMAESMNPFLNEDQRKKMEEMRKMHGERHAEAGGGTREKPKASAEEMRKAEAPKEPSKDAPQDAPKGKPEDKPL
jgi:hypothetical protein